MRLALILGLLLSTSVAYANCSYGPTDFLVFSLSNINGYNSDYQGLTGAAGSIDLSSFKIVGSADASCSSVLAGRNFGLVNGQVTQGGLEAGNNVSISHAFVEGSVFYGGTAGIDQATVNDSEQQVTANVQSLATVSQSFLAASERIANVPLSSSKPLVSGAFMTFNGPNEIQAFDVNTSDLSRANILVFQGAPGALFVVNVHGEHAALDHQDLQLRNGISTGQILFNFVDATQLTLAHSGSQAFGLAMTILAPKAQTVFTSCRITGALYVGNLDGDGQVNPAPFPWGRIPLPNGGGGGCNCGCPHPHGCSEPSVPGVDAPNASVQASSLDPVFDLSL
jgi:choice-of-anchor A domain-containing protein